MSPSKPRPVNGPPKPASQPKDSPGNSNVKVEKDHSKAMPPPPQPPGILEPEMNALVATLNNSVIKAGQVYRFYSDTQKLGIQKYVSSPPRKLISALGREVEKYDHLCDAIEAHLLRAISVLQRDLAREERRAKEAEMATRTQADLISMSPSATRVPLPPESGAVEPEGTHMTINTSATNSLKNSPTSAAVLGRRPSAISISSLHRPPFPLKLDLSSTALRIIPEDTSLFSSGLASPVTLAPRSARPTGTNEFDAELMAAFASSTESADRPVDIDLTLAESDTGPGDVALATLGNSADKPIELDLESMDIDMANINDLDLFGDAPEGNPGDANNSVDDLFSPTRHDSAGKGAENKPIKEEDKLGIEILDALAGDHTNNDIFASFAQDQANVTQPAPEGNQNATLPNEVTSNHHSAPSPRSILATLTASNHMDDMGRQSVASNHHLPTGDAFDLSSVDFPHLSPSFFTNSQGPELNFEDFMNIHDSNMHDMSGT